MSRMGFTDITGWSRLEQSRYEDVLVLDDGSLPGQSVVVTLSVMDAERWHAVRGEPQSGHLVAIEPWEHRPPHVASTSVAHLEPPLWNGTLMTRTVPLASGDIILRSWAFQAGPVVTRIDCSCPVEWFPALMPVVDSLVAGLGWMDGDGPEVHAPHESPEGDTPVVFALPGSTEMSQEAADALIAFGRQGDRRRFIKASIARELAELSLFGDRGQPTAATERFITTCADPESVLEVTAHSGGLVRSLRLYLREAWAAAVHMEYGTGLCRVALLRRMQAPGVMAAWAGLHPVGRQLAGTLALPRRSFERRMADANEPCPSPPGGLDVLAERLWAEPWRIIHLDSRPSGSAESGAHPSSRAQPPALLMAGSAGLYRFGSVGRLRDSVQLAPVPVSEQLRQWILDCGGFSVPGGLFPAADAAPRA